MPLSEDDDHFDQGDYPYHVNVSVTLCLRTTEAEVGKYPELVRQAVIRAVEDDVKVTAQSGYILLMKEGHSDG